MAIQDVFHTISKKADFSKTTLYLIFNIPHFCVYQVHVNLQLKIKLLTKEGESSENLQNSEHISLHFDPTEEYKGMPCCILKANSEYITKSQNSG